MCLVELVVFGVSTLCWNNNTSHHFSWSDYLFYYKILDFISIVLVCYQFQFKSTSELSNLFMLPFVKLCSSDYFIPSKLVYRNSIYISNMFRSGGVWNRYISNGSFNPFHYLHAGLIPIKCSTSFSWAHKVTLDTEKFCSRNCYTLFPHQQINKYKTALSIQAPYRIQAFHHSWDYAITGNLCAQAISCTNVLTT